jgi:hypothetical protein
MKATRWIEIELPSTVIGGLRASASLGDFDSRWVSVVRCGSSETNGLGATAREALIAALAPLGERTTTAFMAAPEMFAASARVLARDVAV